MPDESSNRSPDKDSPETTEIKFHEHARDLTVQLTLLSVRLTDVCRYVAMQELEAKLAAERASSQPDPQGSNIRSKNASPSIGSGPM